MSDADWATLVARWSSGPSAEGTRLDDVSRSRGESGLTALGLRRPDRLDDLLATVSPDREELRGAAARAHLLVRQMSPPHGRAQPELVHLRQLLFPEAGR